uniref:BACK domain-containing protein n=1 Tax=Angiostrongylus cantonensis TaxID=6313 RepID=A0A158PCS1_ANGCA
MYSGKIEIIWEHMTEYMAVTNYLGVVFLHHQLENTLKAMTSEPTTRIEVVNVASHPTTGVSLETASQILQTIHERYATLSMEEIMLLKPWAIRTFAAISVRTPTKISLINILLNWLRDPQNIVWIDTIANNIFIEDMNSQELLAFQRTLRAVLLNPSTRRLVTASLVNGRTIAINMDGVDCRRPAELTAQGTLLRSPTTQKVNLFQPLLRQELNHEQSPCNLSELPSYTNVASAMSSKRESCHSEDSVNYCSDGSVYFFKFESRVTAH